MEIFELIDILEELGIEPGALGPASTLGADAGMDSQEIVELRDRLNRQLVFSLTERSLKNASTLEGVLALVSQQLSSQPTSAATQVNPGAAATSTPTTPSTDFEGHCEASLIIDRSADAVYEALFDLTQW